MSLTYQRFAGSKAEYISEEQLGILSMNDYFVSLKGNIGLRSMLYLYTTPEGAASFFLTSQNDLWYNPIIFPLPNNSQHFHTDTLIDGELNWEQSAQNQVILPALTLSQHSHSPHLI